MQENNKHSQKNEIFAADKELKTDLSNEDLEGISGGETVAHDTYVNDSIVVRNKQTGKILYVLPY